MAKKAVSKRNTRLDRLFASWNKTLSAYLARRPHRSFRRTYRRDYARSFSLPGYFALSRDAYVLLGRNWKLFGSFFAVYLIASAVILGVVSQTNYATIISTLRSSQPDFWPRTLAVFATAFTGGLSSTATANAQILSILLILVAWLTMVWLLRHITNDAKVKFREGLYNSGGPLISTILVIAVGLVQCIPLIIVALSFSAASSTGLLTKGIEAMLYYGAAAGLTLLSLYWLTSTFIALIVATLPGMYPMAAIQAAGDLIIGRRMRLLLRLIWLAVTVVVMWGVILIPIILLDNWISVSWLPLVPIGVLGLSTLTLMVVSTYIYLLYRKLVDDDAKPA